MHLKLFAWVAGGLFVLATAVALGEHSQAGWAARPATAIGRPVSAAIRYNPNNHADTLTPTVTGTPPTATPTPTPDCSSVDVHPTDIWPPGAFISVSVPPGWRWSWEPITQLMRYNCHPYYPTGVHCYWSCTTIEPRIGRAIIHIYDQTNVERCSFFIVGNQPYCPPTASPTVTPTSLTPTPYNTPTTQPTATICAISFTDVPTNHTFYSDIRCLACRGVLGGYADGSFMPQNNITRGQIAKVVSNAAAFQEPVAGQTYQDVPTTHTFYEWIERLSGRGVMGGYPCGGAVGEPCMSGNRPYFRPGSDATRGQLSKIVSNAADYDEEPQGKMFTDVPPNHTFYVWIQRLASRGIIGGYQCGGSGEPCDEQNRPYFRPSINVTRAQASKIVANTFYPNCQTPKR